MKTHARSLSLLLAVALSVSPAAQPAFPIGPRGPRPRPRPGTGNTHAGAPSPVRATDPGKPSLNSRSHTPGNAPAKPDNGAVAAVRPKETVKPPPATAAPRNPEVPRPANPPRLATGNTQAAPSGPVHPTDPGTPSLSSRPRTPGREERQETRPSTSPVPAVTNPIPHEPPPAANAPAKPVASSHPKDGAKPPLSPAATPPIAAPGTANKDVARHGDHDLHPVIPSDRRLADHPAKDPASQPDYSMAFVRPTTPERKIGGDILKRFGNRDDVQGPASHDKAKPALVLGAAAGFTLAPNNLEDPKASAPPRERHQGLRDRFEAAPTDQVKKELKGIEKAIAKHEDRISNPAKAYPGEWETKSLEERVRYIHDKWPKDIKVFEEEAEIARGILRSRAWKPVLEVAGVLGTGALLYFDYRDVKASGWDGCVIVGKVSGYAGGVAGASLAGTLAAPTGPGAVVAGAIGGAVGYEVGSRGGKAACEEVRDWLHK